MKKTFDCVEMKRQAQEAIRKETAGMTREQLLAYWADQHRKMLERRDRSAQSRKSA